MLPGFRNRLIIALLIILMAAAITLTTGGGPQAMLVALFGGSAAVLVVAIGEYGNVLAPAALEPAAALSPSIDEMLDAIGEPVLVVADGRVSHANNASRDLLGGHIVGEDVRLAIRHPGAAERLANPIGGVPQGPVDLVGLGTLDQRWQMRVARASGGERIVHLVDQTGSYAAERMRVDFVANASHELRTPLASILGYIETLGDDQAGADRAVRGRFLRIMFDEARRMQRLVQDLISLSRIEAEKYRLPDQPVDLAALIEEVRGELQGAQDERTNEIVTDIEPGLAPVIGDRVQLSQVLHNLIGNAMKYGAAGTPVTVALHHGNSGIIRLSVADQGDGIAPEHIPRLTERFYRVDAGRSRAAGGTGLGLAIVKHVVERHRGRLDIASTIGKGTVVSILLPAHADAVTKG
jgi:two-component system phosphate regulon sensor histidine kinase PhoR